MNDPIYFDRVPEILVEIVGELKAELNSINQLFAIRDLFGRARFLVDVRPDRSSDLERSLERLAVLATKRLGPRAYPPAQALLYRSELGEDLELPEGLLLWDGPPELRLIDRQITGRAWSRVSDPSESGATAVPRLAFFSLKGGVGRSTAAAVAAWDFAMKGRRVLVVDLDLEAPGLTAGLLPQDHRPTFGIVDWFVEDAVGQGETILRDLVASAPLARDFPGDIRVASSHGRNPGDYLAKLGRCYLDLPKPGNTTPEPWERRLVRLVNTLEQQENPDVMILDVRAGLPDLASVAVTDLGADVLLFAIDSDQTWTGYRLLFDQWKRSGAVYRLRERLTLVAALVPETERQSYLVGLRERAWDLFRETLYDEVEPATEVSFAEEPFSFDLDDPEAPHSPVPVYWNRGLATLGNLHALDETLVNAAFPRFLERVRLLAGGREEAAP